MFIEISVTLFYMLGKNKHTLFLNLKSEDTHYSIPRSFLVLEADRITELHLL